MTTKTNNTVVMNIGSSSQTPVPPRAATPPTIPAGHGEKPQKFNGQNFLTTLGLVRFLTKDPPAKNEDEQDRDYLIALEVWNSSDYLCRHYVMNCLSDSLYDVYSAKKLTKE